MIITIFLIAVAILLISASSQSFSFWVIVSLIIPFCLSVNLSYDALASWIASTSVYSTSSAAGRAMILSITASAAFVSSTAAFIVVTASATVSDVTLGLFLTAFAASIALFNEFTISV